MINPEYVFYLETGESNIKYRYVTEFGATNSKYNKTYVHWLENKYRDLIALQTEANKNV